MIEFRGWPKIARLFRDCVITEKIDGTNAAIGIQVIEGSNYPVVYAQSRKRIITPDDDNYGFAGWVYANAPALVETLGVGLHYGEWWGSGIQRGYGMGNGYRKFSLFNTKRWVEHADNLGEAVLGLGVVPVLYEGPFNTDVVEMVKFQLKEYGSKAAPGFMRPEGVVVYHSAANQMFKSTLENDDAPKETTVRRNLRPAA